MAKKKSIDVCFLNTPGAPTREQVGNKGYHLHQMASLGLPVPPAALLTTDLWKQYRAQPEKTIKHLKQVVIPQVVEYLRDQNGGHMPLVSIRSAGAVSMPGMMDTVLNVGITPDFISRASQGGEGEAFAADVYARFLSMYAHTVLGLDKKEFDNPPSLDSVDKVRAHYSSVYQKLGCALPEENPEEQVLNCVLAVFDSWDNERAVLYRKLHKLNDNAGTAVVVQRMVFGNKNDASATGVLFSRNPNNGAPDMVGEYLVKAQGEDVVSGSHTPLSFDLMKEDFPEAYEQLEKIALSLERTSKQVQDIEFTIEDEKLYILQSRAAKCSPFAKLRMLMDLHRRTDDVSPQDVLDGLTMSEYLDLNVRQVDPSFSQSPDGKGLAASMGALSGRVVFGPSSKYQGDATIFVAKETTPDDLQAIHLATGILTASGGATSHAAVVARGMGKVCVVGCSGLKVEVGSDGIEQARLGSHTLRSGDWITVDANRGLVWAGREVPIVDAQNSQLFWDLEDLVFEANPQWTRTTSKVDEIVKDKSTLFLTYGLDDADDDFMRSELLDASKYLTGVMDLTGKLDFLQSKYPGQFLFGETAAQAHFLRKKKILIDYAQTVPVDHEFDFEVYLGPYEERFESDFRFAGFKVRPQGSISFDPASGNQASLVVVQDEDFAVPPEKLAISSRNALLRVLK